MFHDMVLPNQEQPPIEEMSSPIGVDQFDFCDSELFPPETLQNNNSEVASSSNCCYDQEHSSSYPTNFSITTDMNQYNNEIKNPSTNNDNNLSILFDPSEDQIENDVDFSASIDFTSSSPFSIPPHQYNQEPLINISSLNNHLPPILGPSTIPTTFEEECRISSMPSSYIQLRNSSNACTLMDPMITPYLPSTTINMSLNVNVPFCAESFDFSHQELDFQGENGTGLFLPDNMQRVFNCSNDLQALSSEVHGTSIGTPSTTLGSSEITSLDDATFKVGKLSPEERKKKILRYMKKRNERNFSKKIKYACRKTLADSRPRVRGRFAKNDELLLGDDQNAYRTTNTGNHEYDNEEDVSLYSNPVPEHQDHKFVVKEEDDLDSSDILAHITGVNSFKNYPIQSWI